MSASRPSEVHASAFSDFMRWTCARLQSVGKCGLLRRLSLFRPTSCESFGSHDRIRTCTTNTLNVPPTANWATWPWKWWIQWDSNSHYTAPQAVDSANWSMDPLRRHDSFFTIPQTSPRILDLHQKRLLRLLGKLLLVNWGDLEMVPILQVSTLLPLQRSGLLLCCQRTELTIQPRSITRVSRHWDW